jgi:thiol:disulfide interchange protein DsbD
MRSLFVFVFTLWSTLVSASILSDPVASPQIFSKAQTSVALLPAEKAFIALEPHLEANAVVFELQVAPGYYVYRDKFEVQDALGQALEVLSIPEGETKDDPAFGEVGVLKGMVAVRLSPAPSGKVSFGFQGCAERGVCYPGMKKVFDFGHQTENAISVKSGHSLWWFLLAGIGLAFTPCVLPTLPLLLRVVSGEARHRSGSLLLATSFVVASSVGYALIGMLASMLGSGAQLHARLQSPMFIGIATAIFLFLGLNLLSVRGFSVAFPNFPFIQNMYQRMSGGSVKGAIGLGLVSTFVLSPCVSAPLAGILLYLAQGGNAAQGALDLFVLGLGMGIPLVVIAVGGQSLIPKSGAWLGHVKSFYGVLMLLTSGVILSRILNPSGTLALIGLASIGLAGWLYALSGRPFGVIKTLAAISVGFALASFAGAWKGHDDPLRPWLATIQLPYVEISTRSRLDELLHKSAKAHRPVMVDVSAKWCLNCKVIESRLLEQDVQRRIKAGTDWVKLDITTSQGTSMRQWLEDRGLFGPPAMIFFDAQGVEKPSRQLIGEISSAEVLRAIEGL